jgi:excisionase family DNA binding protein
MTGCPGPHQRLVYSVADAAEQLSISKTVLYELITAGDIAVIRYGEGRRRVGVTHRALLDWIASREAEAAHGLTAGSTPPGTRA